MIVKLYYIGMVQRIHDFDLSLCMLNKFISRDGFFFNLFECIYFFCFLVPNFIDISKGTLT